MWISNLPVIKLNLGFENIIQQYYVKAILDVVPKMHCIEVPVMQ